MRLEKKYGILISTVVLFFLCIGIGYYLSLTKPLWNDEIYTQIRSIDQASYKNIVLGRIPEGNNCPLFYLIQKGICNLLGYQFPFHWDKEWSLSDARSQVIMRLNPNIFISLTIVAIFYFFSQHYSTWAGIYSLSMSLSSFSILFYWAEARPYALWVFLTTIQSLLFLYLIKQKSVRKSFWVWLATIHFLLPMTVVFGALQIIVVTLLITIFKERRWKKQALLTGLALVAPSFYYLHCEKMKFFIEKSFFDLIKENFSIDQMIVLVFYIGLFIVQHFRSEGRKKMEFNIYFIFVVLMLLAALGILTMLSIINTWQRGVFAVSGRYFIFLVPIGIIATTVFSAEILEALKRNSWMVANVLIGLTGILVIRFLKFFIEIMSFIL